VKFTVMNFESVLKSLVRAFDEKGIHFALIGGLAMALRGVQRATLDIDFILLLDRIEEADAILQRFGYHCRFKSANVSHYENTDADWGRIDILHAFRTHSLSMLERAERISFGKEISIPVVQLEDLIGLKIQALTNNPQRATRDWQDIHMLLQMAGTNRDLVDWELIEDYLSVFSLEHKLDELRQEYDAFK
jgi:predicted nucleotidyltransferase